jgi:hypothetical protein
MDESAAYTVPTCAIRAAINNNMIVFIVGSFSVLIYVFMQSASKHRCRADFVQVETRIA